MSGPRDRGRVLVVGGGITGLAAAYELASSGVPTTLVEAAHRFGGKLRTERIEGFLVEAGPDSFITYRPAALQLARELGLEHEIVRPLEPRTVMIRTGGRFRPLPAEMGLILPTALRPFLATPLFSPFEKLRMALDLVLPRVDLVGDVAIGTYLRRRLGPSLVRRLAEPLLGGVYGTPIDELSLLAVLPQLEEANRAHRSLIAASLASRRRRGAGDAGSPFATFAGGVGQLVDGLAATLHRSSDVELRSGVTVTDLEQAGNRFRARLSTGETLGPDAVIVTVPGPAAARLLDATSPTAAAALRTISHGTTAIVSLGYRAEQFPVPPAGHGFLVAVGESLTVDACTISSAKWPGRAPEGTVLIRAFMGSRTGRSPGMSDGALVEAAASDMAATTGARGRPLLAHVARWQNQMPQYTVGHLERVGEIDRALAATPRLQVAGAPYRGVGIPDCVAQGRSAAARVRSALQGHRPA